jgi:hypothetical protein
LVSCQTKICNQQEPEEESRAPNQRSIFFGRIKQRYGEGVSLRFA